MWWAFGLLLAAVYAVLLVHYQGLRFPLQHDETHYWPTTLLFSGPLSTLPAALRNYSEINTPLQYLVFGQLERFTHHGLFLYRATGLVVSIWILVTIARLGDDRSRAMPCAIGLVLCPYFLGMATHMYADMITLGLDVGGLLFYLRGRHGRASLLWILAIACRQIAVAFPLAVLGYEFFRPPLRWRAAWLWPLAACATLGGWMLYYGAAYRLAATAAPPHVLVVYPQHSLYFLASVAVFFCLPELVLFFRRPQAGWAAYRRRLKPIAWAAGALAVLFAIFPPLRNTYPVTAVTMGYFDIAVNHVLPALPRMIFYYALALWVTARLIAAAPRLALWLVAAHFAIMVRTIAGWDKYDLPMLAALWMFTALGAMLPAADKTPPAWPATKASAA